MMRKILHTSSFRMTLIVAAIFTICVLLLGLLFVWYLRASLEDQLRDRIYAEAAHLMIDYNEDGLAELRHDIRERFEANSTNRLLYYIENPGGKVIFNTLTAIPKKQGWHRLQAQNQPILLYVIKLKQGYWFAVGSDLHEIRNAENAMLSAAGIIIFALIILSLLGGMWISRIFLKQIDHIAQAAEQIGNGRLDQRLPLRGVSDDLDRLAGIINQMLDRIEKLVQNLQHVSANIAHDLRTPLGHVRQKLEQIHPADAKQQRLLESAEQEIDELLATFTALLRIAEIESGTRKSGFTRLNLTQLLTKLTGTYQIVAEEAGQKIITHIEPDIYVSGDKELLTQLIVNLIENTIRHAGSPSTLTIKLHQTPHGFMLNFTDNGKGVPASSHAQLLDPFFRVEKSRSQKGNGLGLSLVAAIAELHQFTLKLQDAKPGLSVMIRQN